MHADRPFDAGMLYRSEDQHGPRSAWKTASLVYALRSLAGGSPDAMFEPAGARLDAYHTVADELTRRGIDAVAVLRFGLAPEITSSVLVPAMIWYFTPHGERDSLDLGDLEVEAWRRVLDLERANIGDDVDDESSDLGDLSIFGRGFGFALPAVIAWVLTAPPEHLLLRTPPIANDNPEGGEQGKVNTEFDMEIAKDYRWLVERFSENSLRGWSTDSLHREYRWINDGDRAPCAERLMADRVLDRSGLDAEIAWRVTRSRNADGDVDRPWWLLSKLEEHAQVLLAQERFREAAALFEFALRQHPEDPGAMNDLGFCLAPIAPRDGLFHLENAARSDYMPLAINIHNRMMCHWVLGEARAALRIAGDYWVDSRESAPVAGFLWSKAEDAEWTLFSTLDARLAVARLAEAIAVAEGYSDIFDAWEKHRIDAFPDS